MRYLAVPSGCLTRFIDAQAADPDTRGRTPVRRYRMDKECPPPPIVTNRTWLLQSVAPGHELLTNPWLQLEATSAAAALGGSTGRLLRKGFGVGHVLDGVLPT